jgi:hypothetical protein
MTRACIHIPHDAHEALRDALEAAKDTDLVDISPFDWPPGTLGAVFFHQQPTDLMWC